MVLSNISRILTLTFHWITLISVDCRALFFTSWENLMFVVFSMLRPSIWSTTGIAECDFLTRVMWTWITALEVIFFALWLCLTFFTRDWSCENSLHSRVSIVLQRFRDCIQLSLSSPNTPKFNSIHTPNLLFYISNLSHSSMCKNLPLSFNVLTIYCNEQSNFLIPKINIISTNCFKIIWLSLNFQSCYFRVSLMWFVPFSIDDASSLLLVSIIYVQLLFDYILSSLLMKCWFLVEFCVIKIKWYQLWNTFMT